MNEKEKKPTRNDRAKWTVLLLLLMILILGTVALVAALQRENRIKNVVEIVVSTENSGEGVGLTIDPNAGSGQMYGTDNTAEQDVAISGRRSITIPANKKEITVDFYNPKENAGAYYLTFELRLGDDSKQGYEVLYTSGLLEPGKHIEQITLSRALEKGTYDAIVHIQPYRMNDEKTLTNNADIKTRLIVN
ncbi:MAG: hypothetical protein J1F18_15310 [Lachnospiraceae bacterium]|nr:hypothetical protein [Lachnospiraceae bacterium]